MISGELVKLARANVLRRRLVEAITSDAELTKEANWLRSAWNYTKKNPWTVAGNVALAGLSFVPIAGQAAWAIRGAQLARAGLAARKASQAARVVQLAHKSSQAKKGVDAARATAHLATRQTATNTARRQALKRYATEKSKFMGAKPGTWAKNVSEAQGVWGKTKAVVGGGMKAASSPGFNPLARNLTTGQRALQGLKGASTVGLVAPAVMSPRQNFIAPFTSAKNAFGPKGELSVPVGPVGKVSKPSGPVGAGVKAPSKSAPPSPTVPTNSPYGRGSYQRPSNPYGRSGGYQRPSNPYGR